MKTTDQEKDGLAVTQAQADVSGYLGLTSAGGSGDDDASDD